MFVNSKLQVRQLEQEMVRINEAFIIIDWMISNLPARSMEVPTVPLQYRL